MRLFGARITLTAIIGILIILACTGGAIFAPWLAPHDPNLPMGGRWDPPSAQHWLGLDQIGRDMFSRILYGGRISIGLAMLATILAFVLGVITGLAAAILGGWIDMLFSRFADVVLSIPNLMWALIILSGFGTGAGIIVLTIGLLYSVYVFRVARSVAMNIVVLFVAALSFLGLGVQPPDADWGSMVKESSLAIPAGIAAPLYPAAAIALLTIGVNLVVDWLLSMYSRPQGENA
jgi:peptide/nickel transport system permease protein